MAEGNLFDVVAPIESRLARAESTLSDVRVTVASTSQRLISQEAAMAAFRAENMAQYQDIKRALEPLKEAKWKATGAYSVMAAVVSAGISLAVKFWK
jgi:hypothetical protein